MKQTILRFCVGGNMMPKAMLAFLFLTLCFAFNTQAQIIAPTSAMISPACNLTGTLETRLRSNLPGLSTEVTVKAVISKADATSRLNYVFTKNSSGAVIKTYGPVKYDAVKKQLTQDLVVIPGTTGGFDIRLSVINADGKSCGCSKSVSVLN